MKIVFARKAARARDISIIEAAATTAWVRDEQGRFRWVVVGWLLFWLTATELVIRFVR